MINITTSQNSTISAEELISSCYVEYHTQILIYISTRIKHSEFAEDILQDAFVRLMDYKKMLRPETVKSFIFTIVKNLVIDYVRREMKKSEISANMFENMAIFNNNVEEYVNNNDILNLEIQAINQLTKKRKIVYMLDRYKEMDADEITKELSISKRTVECHLFSSRQIVRDHIKKCI